MYNALEARKVNSVTASERSRMGADNAHRMNRAVAPENDGEIEIAACAELLSGTKLRQDADFRKNLALTGARRI